MINFKVTNAPPINFSAGARQGPAGGGGTLSIPANTALGNFTEATALPTAQTKSAWIEWLDVPTNFAFGGLSATVVGLAGDLVALEALLATKVDTNDPRLLTDGDKGDIVVSGSGSTWTVSKVSPLRPVIVTAPDDASVTAGQTATFAVTAATIANTHLVLTYQWQRSTDGGTTWANISGATADNYTTPATELSWSGYRYRCLVSNQLGVETSKTAELTVLVLNAFAVISFGESNSGGEVANANAFAWELSPRQNLKILDLLDSTWQPLDIGTNNNRDHFGLDATEHAWELGLANLADDGFFGSKDMRLIQTGHGGSRLNQWTVGSTYWTKFLARVAYAKQITNQYAVWITLGINDTLNGTTAANYRTGMQELIGRIKAELPGCKIYISKLMENTSQKIAYNTEIDTIVAADSANLRAVQITGLTVQDSHHWDYVSQKNIAQRISQLMSNDFAGMGAITWSSNTRADGAFVATGPSQRAKSQEVVLANIDAVVHQQWSANGMVVGFRGTDTLTAWNVGALNGIRWYVFNADLIIGDSTVVFSGMTSATIVRAAIIGNNVALQTSVDGGSNWTTRHTWTNGVQGVTSVWLNVEAVLAGGSVFVSLDTK